ncbi:MAG TPA: MFS transporter, partial [Idiomarina sp.]|nr:MFS transporter [Idiomarina sp.]
AYIRKTGKPAILHLKTIRYFGHAGADAEVAYRDKKSIAADFEEDILLHTAAQLVERGVFDGAELAQHAQNTKARIQRVAAEAANRPRLKTA